MLATWRAGYWLSKTDDDLRAMFADALTVAGYDVSQAGDGLEALRRINGNLPDLIVTETYSPAAIENAPATRPATPAISTSSRADAAAATPMTRLAVDTMPSFAPSTAARSHPIRSLR